MSVGVSAVLTVLIVLILSKIFTVLVISPDDLIFQKILSGSITGTPDGHAFFLQYPLGAALAFLYRVCANIPWYRLFLLGSVALCFFLIFTRVRHIAAGRKILYLGTTLLLVLLMFSEDVVHLEWTVISGVLGATALFRFVTMPRALNRWGCFSEYAVCVILLVLCFCLRNTVAYMFIPFAGLCWLRKLFDSLEKPKGEEKKRSIVRLVVFLLVCVILVGAVMVTHMFAYSSEDWQAYKDYTKDRSTLFDYYGYPDYETYAEEYQAAGISYEAYVLMRDDYNFVVPCDNFKQMDIKAIAELAEAIHTEDLKGKLLNTYETVRSVLVGENYLLLNAIILILITCNFLVYKDKKVIDIVFIAAILCWTMAISLYLAYDGRLPERVVRCIDYGLIMTLLGNCMVPWVRETEYEHSRLPGAQKVISVILAVVMLGAVLDQGNQLRKNNAHMEELAIAHTQILQYCAQYPENIYLRDFWSFSQRGELFMSSTSSDNYVNAGGWIYYTPVFNKLLENRDFENLYQAIAENQNLYYLVNENRYEQVANRLDRYFAEKEWPVMIELTDVFETVKEKVFVLKFSSYTSVDITENLTGSNGCQITETEKGLSVLSTGNDAQLYFSVPETEGRVISVRVVMDIQEPTSMQLFTQTENTTFSEEQSYRVYCDPDIREYVMTNPGGQPIVLRIDPTNLAEQEMLVRSVELIVSAPVA